MTRAWLVAVIGILLSHRAEAAEVVVTSQDCVLDSKELERLVRLEISAVTGEDHSGARYEVRVTCFSDATLLRIVDPLTAKSIERRVVPPPTSLPEPERLLALAIGQLYRTSWLELLTEDPVPIAPIEPAGPPAEPAIAAAVARTRPNVALVASAAPSPRAHAPADHEPGRGSFAVEAGAMGRSLTGAPVVAATFGGEGSWRFHRSVRAFLALSAESATASRVTGDVDIVGVATHAGLALESHLGGRFSLFEEAAAGVEYLSLNGTTVVEGYEGRRVDGLAFDGYVGLGAAVLLSRVRFELVPRAGITLGSPPAGVAGERRASVDGLWAGLALSTRLSFE